MAKLLTCTGKKNKVAAVIKHYQQLDKASRINILGKKLRTKRMLIWTYDELKILYEKNTDDPDSLPRGLLKTLDIFTIKDSSMVIAKFGTKQVEDSLLKPKILALSRPFIARKVSVQVESQEIRHSEYRVEHRCTGQITGPLKDVLAYKDLLVKEDLCDPNSLTYIF